ncbi:hypothetical protein QUA81_18555 [Microcoleus sp. F6_B4]
MASNLSSSAAYTLAVSRLQSFTNKISPTKFLPADAKIVRSQLKLTFHTSASCALKVFTKVPSGRELEIQTLSLANQTRRIKRKQK